VPHTYGLPFILIDAINDAPEGPGQFLGRIVGCYLPGQQGTEGPAADKRVDKDNHLRGLPDVRPLKVRNKQCCVFTFAGKPKKRFQGIVLVTVNCCHRSAPESVIAPCRDPPPHTAYLDTTSGAYAIAGRKGAAGA
jgi:hypothetical protein